MDIFEKLDLVDNQMKKDLKEEKRRQTFIFGNRCGVCSWICKTEECHQCSL